MRAAFVDCTPELARVIDQRALPIPNTIEINHGSPTEQQLIGLCFAAQTLLTEHTVISPAVLDACPSLKTIIFMGTGAGTYVDLDDAARRGIKVHTTPGYGNRSVAEHAFALMFAAARNLASMDRQMRAGLWAPTGGFQLKGEKIAVVGLGGIGVSMAGLAGGIGMEVAAWNRTVRDHPAFVADLDEALRDASVVSLHLSLNSETSAILDRRRLLLPRRGFVLVNTARAGLVDEAALLELLAQGQIGHVAVDVFAHEPLPSDSIYRTLKNATLSAHAAYMTDAAYEELWRRTLMVYEAL